MDDLSQVCALLEDIKALLEEQKAERERREQEGLQKMEEFTRIFAENLRTGLQGTPFGRMRVALRDSWKHVAEMEESIEQWAEREEYRVKLHERTNLLLEMILDRLLQVTDIPANKKVGE
jgi:hypothetical protein